MRKVARFYEGKESVVFNSFEDIVAWPDYKLQKYRYYFGFAYPEHLGQNMKIEFDDTKKPERTALLRKRVAQFALRMISLFGYEVKDASPSELGDASPQRGELGNADPVRVKQLYRRENDLVIGLFNPDNFPRITRMLKFLNFVKMTKFSQLLFLVILRAMEEDESFKQLVKDHSVLRDWIKTQGDLDVDVTYNRIMGEEIPEWEKNIYDDALPDVSKSSDAW